MDLLVNKFGSWLDFSQFLARHRAQKHVLLRVVLKYGLQLFVGHKLFLRVVLLVRHCAYLDRVAVRSVS